MLHRLDANRTGRAAKVLGVAGVPENRARQAMRFGVYVCYYASKHDSSKVPGILSHLERAANGVNP
jgi:hypothetical protein